MTLLTQLMPPLLQLVAVLLPRLGTVSKIGAASRPGSQTSRSLTSLDKFCVSRPVIPSSSESEPQGTGDWTIDTVSDVSDVTIEETAVTVSPVTVFSPKDARQMRQVRTNN